MVFPVSRWISRVLRYSGISSALRPTDTGLSPALAGFPTPFSFSLHALHKTLQPRSVDRFGLLRVRSPLLTESSLFLGLLRCFSSPGSLPAAMYSPPDDVALPTPGFPIRRSADQRLFSASPRLIAAVHALHRLLVPRHPPCALPILTVSDSLTRKCVNRN